MPVGHFKIGDLEFEYEGSMVELAHCKELMREARKAEYRLKKAADADKVYVICDRDLKGGNGRFDKIRLRTYRGNLNFTIDVSMGGDNPLGIYVETGRNIKVYNRETEEEWEITPEGETVNRSSGSSQKGPQREERGPKAKRKPSSKGAKEKKTGGSGDGRRKGEKSPESIAETLKKRANVHPDRNKVGNTQIKGGELLEKVLAFADYCNRDMEYMERVLEVLNVQSIEAVRISKVGDLLDLIVSEEKLRERYAKLRDKRKQLA